MHLEFLDYAFKVLARKVRSPQTSAKANSNMLETRIKYQTLSWRINLLHKSNRNLYTSHCVSVFHLYWLTLCHNKHAIKCGNILFWIIYKLL